MAYSVEDLIQLLDLEPLEQNIYRGLNRDIGSGRIFGGQVLAQALCYNLFQLHPTEDLYFL